jgi:twitching motility protein PilI
MSEPQAAFQALLDLAQRSRAAARGLPAQTDIRPHWSGIGFSLMGSNFVAPMGEVSEMLEVPSYTAWGPALGQGRSQRARAPASHL